MKRAYCDRRRTLRVWREHLWRSHGVWPASVDEPVGCICEFQPGRFRKGQRVGGCSRPRCHVCHFDKLMGFPTVQEERANAAFRHELNDLGLLHLLRRTRFRMQAREPILKPPVG